MIQSTSVRNEYDQNITIAETRTHTDESIIMVTVTSEDSSRTISLSKKEFKALVALVDTWLEKE